MYESRQQRPDCGLPPKVDNFLVALFRKPISFKPTDKYKEKPISFKPTDKYKEMKVDDLGDNFREGERSKRRPKK